MALTAIGSETITVGTTAVGFTASKLTNKVHMALCRVETADIRFGVNRTPTAIVGGLKRAEEEFEVWGNPDLKAILFIRDTGAAADAALQVEYFGEN